MQFIFDDGNNIGSNVTTEVSLERRQLMARAVLHKSFKSSLHTYSSGVIGNPRELTAGLFAVFLISQTMIVRKEPTLFFAGSKAR